MIACDAKYRDRCEDLFKTAEKAECATMSASPALTIGWRHSDTDPGIGAKFEMWGEVTANLTQSGIVDRKLQIGERRHCVSLTASEGLLALTADEIVKDLDEAEACRET